MSALTKSRLKISKYGGYVGAVISGVSLAETQDEENYAEIRRALDEHGVIFFEDQPLSMAQYVAFGRKMGELALGDGQPHSAEFPELQVIRKTPDQRNATGDTWHSDQTWRAHPTKATMLRALTIPPYGGDTLFLSAAAAFDDLPETMKDMLRALKAVHSRPFIIKDKQRRFGETRFKDLSNSQDEFAIHPMVTRHPGSGREVLFINPGYTSHIDGWTQEQSAPLLKMLFEHCLQPEYQCRFRWSVNALACWDNRQVWHYASNDYHGHLREMQRLMVQ